VFQFDFLDQAIDDFYKAEMKLYTLFKVFAGLAMCISCLGLWGLATYAAQNRTKEIGIRKVLGASVTVIVVLLSKDFLSMVAIALAVAAPLVHYFINNWLQNFAYHIAIEWEIFIIAGGASILIALITVTIQTLKAALANPVDSLRSE
jgi:putative ABC transport system permease protein